MKQTEVEGIADTLIPDDWEVKNVGETCHVYTGGEAPSLFSKEKNELYEYPIYSNGRDIYGYCSSYTIPHDAVCISSIGENTGDVFYYEGKFTPIIRLKVIVPKEKNIETKYLYYYLKTRKIDGTKNGGIPNINSDDVKNLNFVIPPLQEQQRIAKALSDVDALITTTEKLIQKKKNIKQGTMQNLLTGKKRLPGFAKSTEYKQTELGLIPEDWEVRSLGEIAETFTGLTYSPKDVYEYGTLVLRSSNIKDEHLCYEDNVYVQMDIPDRAIVREGDILVCVRNGSKALIGKSTQITKEASGMAFGAFMTVLRTDKIDQNFLLYVWQSDKVQKQVTDNLGATINQITNADFNKFWITIPRDRKEQTTIANVLSSMDKEIETLNTKLEKYRNLKTAMMQQLLTGKIRLVK